MATLYPTTTGACFNAHLQQYYGNQFIQSIALQQYYANNLAQSVLQHYAAIYPVPNPQQTTFGYQLPSPLQRQKSQSTYSLSLSEVSAGSIAFLPQQDVNHPYRCIRADCEKEHHIEAGAFNHPILILNLLDRKHNDDEPIAFCCIVSSTAVSSPIRSN
jgi:hypothetical protein